MGCPNAGKVRNLLLPPPRPRYNFCLTRRSNFYRIRTANILLITLRGLGNEIAKNLVLSGVGSLTLLDDAQIQAKDLGAQFLISEESLQQNVGLRGALLFLFFRKLS